MVATRIENCSNCESKQFLVVSPNGKRVAIIERRGQKLVFIVDGVESKEYDLDPALSRPRLSEHHFLFSPDSERFMHVARQGKKKIVVVDGTEQEDYSSVYALTFSLDSKRFVGSEWKVVVDGVEGKGY